MSKDTITVEAIVDGEIRNVEIDADNSYRIWRRECWNDVKDTLMDSHIRCVLENPEAYEDKYVDFIRRLKRQDINEITEVVFKKVMDDDLFWEYLDNLLDEYCDEQLSGRFKNTTSED